MITIQEFRDLPAVTKRAKLTKYAQAYYDGEPIVSDQWFDQLCVEFKKSTGEDLPIGYGYRPVGIETEHLCQPVASLEKMKAETLEGQFDSEELVEVTPKVDGGSGVAYYWNGILDKIVSRGLLGLSGIDITENLRHAVPATVPSSANSAVRGEIALTWEDFWDIGEGVFPRNKATGLSQSQKVPKEQVRKLKFLAYDLMHYPGTKEEVFQILVTNHFETLPVWTGQYKDFCSLIESEDPVFFTDSRMFKTTDGKTIPYDGLVVCSRNTRRTKHPELKGRWDLYTSKSIAFKFEDEEAESTVRAIEWNLAPTGREVPVAIIDPVKLPGATVGRVTLNNYTWAQGCGVGAKIKVIRANMCIPYLKEILVRSDDLGAPTHCQACGTKLEMSVDSSGQEGADLICVNRYCSRNESVMVMNVLKMFAPKGLSTSSFNKFLSVFTIGSLVGLGRFVNGGGVIRLIKDAFPPALAKKLTQMVENIRIKPKYVKTVLQIANITQLGEVSIRRIHENVKAQHFKNMIYSESLDGFEPFCDSQPSFLNLRDAVGRVWSVLDFFGGDIVDDVLVQVETRVAYCVTGSVSITKAKLAEEFQPFGAKQVSISKADVLIANAPSVSDKYTLAVKRGIPIMTENRFRNEYIKHQV